VLGDVDTTPVCEAWAKVKFMLQPRATKATGRSLRRAEENIFLAYRDFYARGRRMKTIPVVALL
jgi:hypothetical protein